VVLYRSKDGLANLVDEALLELANAASEDHSHPKFAQKVLCVGAQPRDLVDLCRDDVELAELLDHDADRFVTAEVLQSVDEGGDLVGVDELRALFHSQVIGVGGCRRVDW